MNFRSALLILMAINLVMSTIAFLMYPPLLQMPNALGYILKVLIMLVLYFLFVVRFTGNKNSLMGNALNIAFIFGLVSAAVEIVHISIENFGRLNGKNESSLTGIFMLLLLIIFLTAGFTGTWKTRNLLTGLYTGIWTSIICMLIVGVFGLSQLYWSFDAVARHDVGDPDFIRTGWTNFHAFVIADILEACFKIWLMTPIAGVLLAFTGASMAILLRRRFSHWVQWTRNGSGCYF